jgi:uncharacterized protein
MNARLSLMDRMAYYTVADIGRTRKETPEGFTLCEGVAIARTGVQVYSKDDVPTVEADYTGQIRITRLPEEVFRDETMASFEGKPVTIEHPNSFVSPENWQDLAVGVVQNVRRGQGTDADLLIADLLITSAAAINYVNEEKPQLSAGYNADYEQTEPGAGIQRNIIGNHVALLARGRAGPRVAIKDSLEPTNMSKSFLDRVKEIAGLTDEKAAKAAAKALVTDGDDDDCGKKSMDARLRDAESWIADRKMRDEAEAKEKKEKEETEARDRAARDAAVALAATTAEKVDVGTVYTGDSAMTEVASRAEILCPGIKIPTADAAKAGGAMRTLLSTAVAKGAETNDGVKGLVAGRDLAKVPGPELVTLFHAASELVRASNNERGTHRKINVKDFGGPSVTPASMNEANRKYWSQAKTA